MKILTIDDDESVRQALTVSLKLLLQDVEVLQADDGESGLERFFDTNPDLVLLDVNMPRMSGFEVLREIRRVSDVPVIMLTARDEDMDQVRGFELGADEYLHKPIRHATLVARIKSALRRAARAPIDEMPDFVAAELAIHFQNQQVTVNGEEVKLTPIEYRLLHHLVRNAGHVLPHQALLDRVWGTDHEVGPEYLKVFISRVRAKLRRPGSRSTSRRSAALGIALLRVRDRPYRHHELIQRQKLVLRHLRVCGFRLIASTQAPRRATRVKPTVAAGWVNWRTQSDSMGCW